MFEDFRANVLKLYLNVSTFHSIEFITCSVFNFCIVDSATIQ